MCCKHCPINKPLVPAATDTENNVQKGVKLDELVPKFPFDSETSSLANNASGENKSLNECTRNMFLETLLEKLLYKCTYGNSVSTHVRYIP